MLITFQVLAIIVLSFVVVICTYYLWEGRRFQGKNRVVYMGTNLREQGEVIAEVIRRYVPSTNQYTLIEPGAGLATAAFYLSKKFSWKKVEAIELRHSVAVAARVLLWLKGGRILYLEKDLFSYVGPRPAVIYCYLTTTVLNSLHKKEFFNDALVICLTFEIEGVEPLETIELKSWQGKIRVYDFRNKKTT